MPPTSNDIRRGFVYERVPHVTLKSIAQNPDIHEGMSREEIDAAIARHAETEMLFDRPYEDRKIVRVSGPFTVESLSPHRVLRRRPGGRAGRQDRAGGGCRALRDDHPRQPPPRRRPEHQARGAPRVHPPRPITRASASRGSANTWRPASPRPSLWRIGPEFGTVGPELIRDAAKEAVKVADLLVVCGFAFDPMAGEEASTLGRLTILQARMNPDLAMGDELLKKTGSGNLFMVFGEPDIEDQADRRRPADARDPRSGRLRPHHRRVRSTSVDDIAAWFLDTDYDGDAFIVRHAYFTGADDPYDKLRRALRADISDEAWATVNSTVSRPFPRPTTGKIAVKVINHYGDEVMKVFMA